ncbi:unnamed protein product, partial [Lampetra fluviatilis]
MEYFEFPKERYHFVGTTITITEFMSPVAEASVAWESGVRLARFLEANQQRYPLAGRSVLELGAGTGLVSIVCSLLGARVTATDVKEVLSSLSTNIANNTRSGAGRPEVRELSWGRGLSAFDAAAYDYVVASDLVYREASLGPLALTLRHFLAGGRGATAFFSLKSRFSFCADFLSLLRRMFRVRSLEEWPEERMLLWEISERRAEGVREGAEAGDEVEIEEEEEFVDRMVESVAGDGGETGEAGEVNCISRAGVERPQVTAGDGGEGRGLEVGGKEGAATGAVRDAKMRPEE